MTGSSSKVIVLGLLLVPLVGSALWSVSDVVAFLFVTGSVAFAYLMQAGVVEWHG